MLMVLVREVYSILTSTPSDVAVVTGIVFSWRCSTNISQHLLWYRLAPGASSEEHIVDRSEVNEKFGSVYSVQYGNQGSNLTIVAEQSTAAKYACIETYTNNRATAQVTVLQSEPSCSTHGNGDIMNLTCVVIFSGHVNPIVKWTRVADNEEKEVTVGIENITQGMGPLINHTSTLSVLTNEVERNHFQVYRYLYTVKFCIPDNATVISGGKLCIFPQLISFEIGKESSGTTSGIDEEGTVGGSSAAQWWLFAIVPVAVGLVFVVSFYLYKRLKRDEQTAAAQRELGVMLPESHKD